MFPPSRHSWLALCVVTIRWNAGSSPSKKSSAAVQKATILVLASEDVISELLGAMVELDGFEPVFPSADERPLDAVRRSRAALVLIDCEHDLAWDTAAIRAIADAGSRMLLFSAMRSQPEVEAIAGRHGLAGFVLPLGFREFAATVGNTLTPQPHLKAENGRM